MITHAPQNRYAIHTLGHTWRHVASKQGTEWIWHGDLISPEQRELYRVMRDEHRTLLQISRRIMVESELLFAAISKAVDPTTAYDAAHRFLSTARARSAQAKLIQANARRRLRA